MSNTVDISLIIPVYNVEEKYFRECLDSVLAQNMRKIEAIIADDGSTNGCGEIADEYAAGGSVMPGMDIYYNDTNNYSSKAYSVFNNTVLETYKNSLLTERYGDVDYLSVFNINTENICKESMANTQFIRMMLPYMVIMLLFAGVMSVGVDAIAGEKERGTLASMLISPVKRSEIAAGKLIAESL